MARKFRGVNVRGEESIQIEFTYKGKRCRESLKLSPTDANLRYANNRRIEILSKIERGSFDYPTEFPESNSAMAKASKNGCHILVKDAMNDWLVSCQKRHAYSTVRDYNSAVRFHLEPRFGHYTLDELNRQEIETWINGLDISAKRINNILIPLRQIMERAFHDELIDNNPMSRIKNLKIQTREPEPFTLKEIDAILEQLKGSPKNAVQFGFWTGLRTSELLGLKWENVSIDEGTAVIKEALVYGRMKQPKTRAGERKISLHENALLAIKAQLTIRTESPFIFHDPKTLMQWASDQPFRKRVWIPALKAAKVKYRECYQMRHTFASQMLSQNTNPLWLASHMGHKDWSMIVKNYGRWVLNS
ncbi:site-specific integrase [Zhongshania aquimaris]|uniref:Site-specific integrase n=1 Tax=Zhongshania aquimaris TaxID=2857107 RepID=A0ABS6VQB0_9GAMM|nr:site-specific integrase [Zhongshania aquimaris]MBW2940505.1 site-specific integrase [Zhongshania aquimaris]